MASQTILIADDEATNLEILSRLLRPPYLVRAANSGEQALRVARTPPRPDLVLLDVMMPGMNGHEVLEQLRLDAETRDIPVVFVTAMADPGDEERGFQLGAADYITKPFRPAVLRARVRTQLEAKLARDWLRDQNATLEAEVARRVAENDLTQRVSIRALAHLAETRDPETGRHIMRTQAYVEQLAQRLRHHPRFAGTMTQRYIDLLTRSAPLHDIGKVGVPDRILLKPGPLDADEWVVMRTHPMLGCAAIEQAERDIEVPLEFLSVAKDIVRWHHERWDGRGYPDGLRGEAIPIAARLMAVADVFDALISPRVYKEAIPYAEAGAIIAAGRGTHFDPDVVDAFQAAFTDITALADQYGDPVRRDAGGESERGRA